MWVLKLVCYQCWLFFGGKRTEDGFRHLSQSIVENRKLISELRAQQMEFSERLWKLEGHTTQETMERAVKQVQSFTDQCNEFNEVMGRPTANAQSTSVR